MSFSPSAYYGWYSAAPPKWITLLLWGVVGLRLVLPVTLGDLFDVSSPEMNSAGILSVESGEIASDLPLDNLHTTDFGTDENNVDLFLIDNRVNNFLDSKISGIYICAIRASTVQPAVVYLALRYYSIATVYYCKIC